MNSTPLHLVEPEGPGCGPCTLALVGAQAAAEDARIVVLGTKRAAQKAIDAGCRVDISVPAPLGIPRLARSGIRSAWQRGKESSVVAWSEGAAAAAALLPKSVHLEAKISAVFGRVPWVEPWLRSRVHVTGIGRDVSRLLASRGWCVGPAKSVAECGRPAAQELTNRREVRRSWGAEDGELVIACVSDPPEALDLYLVYAAAVVTTVSGRRVRVVAHPQSNGVDRVVRFSRSLLKNQLCAVTPLILDERLETPWLVAEGVDCLMQVFPSGKDTKQSASLLPVLCWGALGVPATLSHRFGLEEVIQSGVDSEAISADDRNKLTRILLRHCDEPERLAKMGQAAEKRWKSESAFAGSVRASSAH